MNVPTGDQLVIAHLLFPRDTEYHDLLLDRLQAEEGDDDDEGEDEHFCTGPNCCSPDVIKMLTFGPKLGKTFGIDKDGHLIDHGYHNRAPGELPPGAYAYTIKGYNDDSEDPDELDVFYADRRNKAGAEPILLMDGTALTECELCGEPIDDEMGEFTKGDTSVIAHGQCGIDAGLDMA
jgi:hypothetical protein